MRHNARIGLWAALIFASSFKEKLHVKIYKWVVTIFFFACGILVPFPILLSAGIWLLRWTPINNSIGDMGGGSKNRHNLYAAPASPLRNAPISASIRNNQPSDRQIASGGKRTAWHIVLASGSNRSKLKRTIKSNEKKPDWEKPIGIF